MIIRQNWYDGDKTIRFIYANNTYYFKLVCCCVGHGQDKENSLLYTFLLENCQLFFLSYIVVTSNQYVSQGSHE